MPSLIDIASATTEVAGVRVRALSGADIADLLGRFTELRKAMSGVSISTEELIAVAPNAVAAAIAVATMPPEDKADPAKKTANEQAAVTLGVGLQVDFLDAIIKLSIPAGIGPFMERLEALTAGLDGRGAAPVTKSPKPSKP